ncbi:MAG: TPM domain-containing protein [bacterium]|nr:TPM domain-containing protein [bacterium]
MRTQKRIFLLLCFFVLCWTGSVFAAEEQGHLYDYADLFTQAEEEELEAALQQEVKSSGMDFVVLTIEDAEGKSAEQYGEDFYIDGNFGFDEEYSGALFLIDMDNREIFYTPVGKMNYYVTDSRRDAILDSAFSYVADGAYAQAALFAVQSTEKYVRSGADTSVYSGLDASYVGKRLTGTEIGIAVLAAAGIAFLPCLGIVGSYTKKRNKQSTAGFRNSYRSQSAFLLSDQRDVYQGKNVTTIRIPKAPPPSSSGHGHSGGYSGSNVHSSSGRTFNGGSRKF